MGIKSFLMPGFTIRPGKWPKKSYLLVFAQSCPKNARLLPAESIPALLKVSACCKTSSSKTTTTTTPQVQELNYLSFNSFRFQSLHSVDGIKHHILIPNQQYPHLQSPSLLNPTKTPQSKAQSFCHYLVLEPPCPDFIPLSSYPLHISLWSPYPNTNCLSEIWDKPREEKAWCWV